MKKLIPFILLILAACKENNQMGTVHRPVFTFNSHLVVRHETGFTETNKKLLHQIFTKKIDPKFEYPVDQNKLNKSYEENFARVIVINKNKDTFYYVPENFDMDIFEKEINLERDYDDHIVYLNKTPKIGKTTYVVLTSTDELMRNEADLLSKEFELNNVDEIEINDLSKYQKVKLDIVKFRSLPEFATNKKSGSVKFNSRDFDHEVGPGHCDYFINLPTSNFQKYEQINDEKISFDVSVNKENSFSQESKNWEIDFYNENELNQLNVKLESYKNQFFRLESFKTEGNCKESKYYEELTIGLKQLYKVKVKIFGPSIEMIEKFDWVREL